MHGDLEHNHIQITLCKAEGRQFCLSDNPVLSKRSLVGAFDFDFNHFLPISPNLALMFHDIAEVDSNHEIGREILRGENITIEEFRVHAFNLMQIHRAHWHVCFSCLEYANSYLFALND